ncbi:MULTISPECIES: outer membrane protein [Helicobacter]|uniref:outer membrane protein n=1 Tax=Helicobacter TaxID=209 RepID=UPI000EB315F2|nr:MULTISPECIES: outer membrane protein [Helicobacter]
MKQPVLKTLSWIGMGFCSLCAESNGFYSDIGFEFSRMQTIEHSNAPGALKSLRPSTQSSILYKLFRPGASKADIAAAARQIAVIEGIVKDSSCATKGCLVSQAQMQNVINALSYADSINLAISTILKVLPPGTTYDGVVITQQNIGQVLFDYMSKNSAHHTGQDGTLGLGMIPFNTLIHSPTPLSFRDIRVLRASMYWLFAPMYPGGSSLLNTFSKQVQQSDPFASGVAFKTFLQGASDIAQGQQDLNNVLKNSLTSMSTAQPQQLRDLLSYYRQLEVSPAIPTLGILEQFINMGSQDSNMYGVDIQFGFKHFFGAKRRFGLRYYEYFSYQHGNSRLNGALNNFIYGAGIDVLWNFYESQSGDFTSGLFAGLILAGSSWLVQGSNGWVTLTDNIKASGGSARLDNTFFQLPINIGLRTNIGTEGFEIGMRFPVIDNTYFKGTISGFSETLVYKTQMSIFFNWVHNF